MARSTLQARMNALLERSHTGKLPLSVFHRVGWTSANTNGRACVRSSGGKSSAMERRNGRHSPRLNRSDHVLSSHPNLLTRLCARRSATNPAADQRPLLQLHPVMSSYDATDYMAVNWTWKRIVQGYAKLETTVMGVREYTTKLPVAITEVAVGCEQDG